MAKQWVRKGLAWNERVTNKTKQWITILLATTLPLSIFHRFLILLLMIFMILMILTTTFMTVEASQDRRQPGAIDWNLSPLREPTRNGHPSSLVWLNNICAIDVQGLSISNTNLSKSFLFRSWQAFYPRCSDHLNSLANACFFILVVTLEGTRSPKNVPDALSALHMKETSQDMFGSNTKNGLNKRAISLSK